ncbi:hypothetical protein BYT27DRAFT_7255803 [Phlegmacium glaucopus]|nr:hypothetical protein BYT27DRAFT_7255803 [Phlegmacium glaucopus]
MPLKSSTHTSSCKKPGKSKSGQNRSNPTPSYKSVQKTVKDSKKKHGKSKKTTDNYDGNVHQGKEFIAAYVRATCIPTSIKPLSSLPIEYTPTALAMFIAQKCFTEECGKSTASAIHAAFLRYYDTMAGDKFHGHWHFDTVNKEWIGNPVCSAEVGDILEACKYKNGVFV